MLLIITAVSGAPVSEICASAFCTAIAETPNMPARIASGVRIDAWACGDAEDEGAGA